MKTTYSFLILFIVYFFSSEVFAQVKLPALFSDNMVLQQRSEAAIWGSAKAGAAVSVSTSWDKKKYKAKADQAGKWKLKVATPSAGGPYEITISDGTAPVILHNLLIGEVWVCSGQSNMEMPMKGFKGQPVLGSNEDILRSKNSAIRFITVPRSSQVEPQHDFKGQWLEAAPESVSEFSATAYYFGSLLHELLDVPIGLVNVSYGGSNVEAWMNEAWLKPFNIKGIPATKDSIKVPNRTPTVLYNGMLHPVIGFTMKGCIWYQGESNYTAPAQYEKLFETMVREWRNAWGLGEFPFYYAQIAPFNYAQYTPDAPGKLLNSAFLRDAQRKAMDKIPNCGMAVLMDTGEKECIHPARKKEAGHRLAYWALAKTYGVKGFGYASPVFDTMAVTNDKVVVSFENIPNGLTSFGKELTCFEIAGADKHFYPAKAVIGRKSVTLTAPEVKEPVAVRYAFQNFVVGDLFSTEGLPASSFRTDDWEQ
jgi:sialate O-acetylesterase